MFEKELKIEKEKRVVEQMGRCATCKFSNHNYGAPRHYMNYCHVREENMDKGFFTDFFAIMFCRHFKRVEVSKDGE